MRLSTPVAIGLSLATLTLFACGGASSVLDSSYSGKTYTGSFSMTSPSFSITTGTMTFSKNDVTGTWNDGGTTRNLTGNSVGLSVTVVLQFASGTYTYSGSTSVNGSGHLVGTLNGTLGGTLTIDLTSTV